MNFDSYNLKARVYPTLIALMPLLFLSIYYITNFKQYYHYITFAISASFLTYLFSQLGRDLGKRKEGKLFSMWGGKPTTMMLRNDSTLIDTLTKSRYRRILSESVQDIELPDVEFERQNSQMADEVYECCTSFLRTRSRDIAKYKMIHQENTNYGFRRNVYGLKNLGLIILFLCTLIHALVATRLFSSISFSPNQDAYLYTSFLVLALFWLIVVSSNWVKLVAIEYAKRLFEQLDEITFNQ